MMSRIAWIVATFVVLGSTQSALAGQHQNANLYAFWDWSGTGFWNVDQIVRIDEKAQATFWAEQFLWTGRSDGGFIGLQTHGSSVSARRGDTALFSIWNATAARGANCQPFAGEGVGRKCALAYPFKTGRYYRLRIWRMEADAQGQWWAGFIKDTQTGANTWIGSIRAPVNATSIRTTTNFVEYFGPQVSCFRVPRSTAVFTQPAANLGSGGYEFGSSFSRSTRGACTRGAGTAVDLGWTQGARVVHGSRVPSATRVLFIHGFERGGKNNCEGTWGELMDAYRELGWTGNFIPISYYADDSACSSRTRMWNVDLGGYGSHDKTQPSGHVKRKGVIVGHSTDARIKHLAQHLAWTIHDRYSSKNDPVKIVAHSMGGLITRSAIKETQARNPDFPPRLLIEDVVTLGTPHTGSGIANLCALTHEQCRDLRPDSDFLNDLDRRGHNPQADGFTEWTLIGASDDDVVTSGSATNMDAPNKIVYHSGQGVEHGQYAHKKTGPSLRDTNAAVTIEQHGVRCSANRSFWPVTLSWVALGHQVDDCR